MDYSFCGNITIYCAASLGESDDETATYQLAESDYKSNVLWQGALFFPHATEDSADWMARLPSAGYRISVGSNWNTSLQYIPAFGVANGVFNTRGHAEFYSSYYSPYFSGMTSIYPGITNDSDSMRWHIVTCKNRANAYVYEIAGAGHEACYLAEIQSDGSLITDTSVRLCMPRFTAGPSFAYLHGCLIHGGVTEDNRVTDIHDFEIRDAWNDRTIGGLHIAVFNRLPSAHAATVDFLNRWALNRGGDPSGGGGFDLNSFLTGYACGRQVKGWAMRRE